MINNIKILLPELVRLEMPPDMKEKPEGACSIDCDCSPERAVIAVMLGKDAAEQDSQPQAGIP